jgi:hypothetical protein
VVQTALEMGPARDSQSDNVLMTKNRTAEVLLKKVSELQVKKAGDLEEIIGQLEKLLESDDVRRVRHLRNAVITIAIVAGGVCFSGLAFLAGRRAPPGLLLAVVATFFTFVVPALLFMLYRLSKSPQQSSSPPTKPIQVNLGSNNAPALTASQPSTITEHTTRQLDDPKSW